MGELGHCWDHRHALTTVTVTVTVSIRLHNLLLLQGADARVSHHQGHWLDAADGPAGPIDDRHATAAALLRGVTLGDSRTVKLEGGTEL